MHSCYHSQTKFGEGNIFAPVCHSVHRGGVPDTHPPGPGTPCKTRYTPWDKVHPPGTRYTPQNQVHHTPRDQVHHRDQVHPPGPGPPPGIRYTPQDQVCPGTRYTPWDQVHPPGPDTPLSAEHAGRYGQHAGGTHPTGMQSCSFCVCVGGGGDSIPTFLKYLSGDTQGILNTNVSHWSFATASQIIFHILRMWRLNSLRKAQCTCVLDGVQSDNT